MLCLSRDLRAFCVSIPLFRGAALRCVCFSGVCGDCLAAGCRGGHGGGVRRPRSQPEAVISPEGDLARRQREKAPRYTPSTRL